MAEFPRPSDAQGDRQPTVRHDGGSALEDRGGNHTRDTGIVGARGDRSPGTSIPTASHLTGVIRVTEGRDFGSDYDPLPHRTALLRSAARRGIPTSVTFTRLSGDSSVHVFETGALATTASQADENGDTSSTHPQAGKAKVWDADDFRELHDKHFPVWSILRAHPDFEPEGRAEEKDSGPLKLVQGVLSGLPPKSGISIHAAMVPVTDKTERDIFFMQVDLDADAAEPIQREQKRKHYRELNRRGPELTKLVYLIGGSTSEEVYHAAMKLEIAASLAARNLRFEALEPQEGRLEQVALAALIDHPSYANPDLAARVVPIPEQSVGTFHYKKIVHFPPTQIGSEHLDPKTDIIVGQSLDDYDIPQAPVLVRRVTPHFGVWGPSRFGKTALLANMSFQAIIKGLKAGQRPGALLIATKEPVIPDPNRPDIVIELPDYENLVHALGEAGKKLGIKIRVNIVDLSDIEAPIMQIDLLTPFRGQSLEGRASSNHQLISNSLTQLTEGDPGAQRVIDQYGNFGWHGSNVDKVKGFYESLGFDSELGTSTFDGGSPFWGDMDLVPPKFRKDIKGIGYSGEGENVEKWFTNVMDGVTRGRLRRAWGRDYPVDPDRMVHEITILKTGEVKNPFARTLYITALIELLSYHLNGEDPFYIVADEAEQWAPAGSTAGGLLDSIAQRLANKLGVLFVGTQNPKALSDGLLTNLSSSVSLRTLFPDAQKVVEARSSLTPKQLPYLSRIPRFEGLTTTLDSPEAVRTALPKPFIVPNDSPHRPGNAENLIKVREGLPILTWKEIIQSERWLTDTDGGKYTTAWAEIETLAIVLGLADFKPLNATPEHPLPADLKKILNEIGELSKDPKEIAKRDKAINKAAYDAVITNQGADDKKIISRRAHINTEMDLDQTIKYIAAFMISTLDGTPMPDGIERPRGRSSNPDYTGLSAFEKVKDKGLAYQTVLMLRGKARARNELIGEMKTTETKINEARSAITTLQKRIDQGDPKSEQAALDQVELAQLKERRQSLVTEWTAQKQTSGELDAELQRFKVVTVDPESGEITEHTTHSVFTTLEEKTKAHPAITSIILPPLGEGRGYSFDGPLGIAAQDAIDSGDAAYVTRLVELMEYFDNGSEADRYLIIGEIDALITHNIKHAAKAKEGDSNKPSEQMTDKLRDLATTVKELTDSRVQDQAQIAKVGAELNSKVAGVVYDISARLKDFEKRFGAMGSKLTQEMQAALYELSEEFATQFDDIRDNSSGAAEAPENHKGDTVS